MALVGAAWAGVFIQSRLFPEAGSQVAQPVQLSLAELPVGSVNRITYGSTPVLVHAHVRGAPRQFS